MFLPLQSVDFFVAMQSTCFRAFVKKMSTYGGRYPHYPHYPHTPESPYFGGFPQKFAILFFETLCYNKPCSTKKGTVDYMCNITIKTNNSIDYTTISNDFLDNYMPAANGEYVKIYLYLLRAMSAPDMEISVSSIADKFDYTEKDVLRALTHWSNAGLLNIGYNEAKEVNSITFGTASVNNVQPAQATKAEKVYKEQDDVDYTPSQMANFKKNDDFAMLLHIIASYWVTPLRKPELKDIAYFYDPEGLGFSTDLIDYLFEYCIEKDKKDISYIRSVAINWHKNGITSREEAKEFESSFIIYKIRKASGINTSGKVTPAERECYNRWKVNYGFSDDTILEACNETVLNANSSSINYLDKILTNWHLNGKNVKPAKTSRNAQAKKTANTEGFNSFEQRTYDFADLERKLANL